MKSYPTMFKSLLWKIVQMGTLQKLQNSIQTLIIFGLSTQYPNPYKFSVLGDICWATFLPFSSSKYFYLW